MSGLTRFRSGTKTRVGPLAAPAAGLLLGALEHETEEASRCGYWNALVAVGPAAASQVSQARRVLGETAAVCEKARVPAVSTP